MNEGFADPCSTKKELLFPFRYFLQGFNSLGIDFR
jgi:hypothetical protein